MQQFYNPYMTPQQRLHYMEQQYSQFTPQPMQTTLCAIPVSNIDEANAFRVDLNGTPTLFYNAGANEVYLKRTNTQTGAADFIKFVKASAEIKPAENANHFKILSDKIDGLYSLIAPTQEQVKGNKNVKQ